MRGYTKHKVDLTPEARRQLERLSRQRTAPYREVMRAKVFLLAADGKRNVEIARALGVEQREVTIWIKDFGERGLESLRERQRPGRTRSFSPLKSEPQRSTLPAKSPEPLSP